MVLRSLYSSSGIGIRADLVDTVCVPYAGLTGRAVCPDPRAERWIALLWYRKPI